MRKIYLIRHGLPHFPGGLGYCLGAADFPLDIPGRLQACQLGHALKDEKLTVFTSPLKRACDTAGFIAPSPTVIDGLQEMHAGDWDGLSFIEIQKRWPELFKARAENTALPIPGAEVWEEGQARFVKAVNEALSQSSGDIAIVAHTTVILAFICSIMDSRRYQAFSYRQDYGSYYLVRQDEAGFHCEFPWQRPLPELSEQLCRKLMAAAEVPEHIIRHSEAVAETAMELCNALDKAGLSLDRAAIYHAALLHDIARLRPEHPETGAKWLEALGHSEIANIVRQHHEVESEDINEAAVLFIADKLVQEDRRLSLKERFEKSLEKCSDAGAIAAHGRRMAQAMEIAEKINRLCDREVIK